MAHEGGGRIEHVQSLTPEPKPFEIHFLEINLTRNDNGSNIGQSMKKSEFSRWTHHGNLSRIGRGPGWQEDDFDLVMLTSR